jgi:peptide deformylase
MNTMSESESNKEWQEGGAVRGIVTVGDPRLRVKSRPVDDIRSVLQLCEAMTGLLRRLNGAGLAAPQIGENVRVMVIEVRKTDLFPDRPPSQLYVIINPEIITLSERCTYDWEGCFSTPGLLGLVRRAERLRMRFTSPDGKQRDEWFEGYLARVIQHEYDHLEGRIFLSRMESMDTLSTVENWKNQYSPRK